MMQPSRSANFKESKSAAEPIGGHRERFFGVHFDFHCQKRDHKIGRRVTPAMVRRVIDALQPDFIQIDCKGHPGIASYPSRIGSCAPSFVGDPLKVWRKETARAGVSRVMHYSGVVDVEAVAAHPSWAACRADGKPDARATSVFGPYVDRLMIPQLLELAKEYGVDGVWVDGDCWGAMRDYSKWSLAAWRVATGKKTAPKTSDSPDWQHFAEFCREGFRKYLAHYVQTLHQQAPGFQVASNWAYSSHMPETPSIDVDFLSGDFAPENSLNSARFEARILATQGRPWDLMSWGFATRWSSDEPYKHRAPKTSVQLMQEAAVVLALGGGYQCYFAQKRDGSISDDDLRRYRPVAEFCSQRRELCFKTDPASEIAVLYSTSGFYRQSEALFNPGGVSNDSRGVVSALVESGLSVDIIHDGHLARGLEQYRVIIVPEWSFLSKPCRLGLLRFARNGGTVLVIGVGACRLFSKELGVKIGPDVGSTAQYWSIDSGASKADLAGVLGVFAKSIRPARGTKLFGRIFAEHDFGGDFTPAGAVRKLGRGSIAGLFLPLGKRYLSGRSVGVRMHLKSVVEGLLPDPLVQMQSRSPVDLTVRRRGEKLLINLINAGGIDPAGFTWDYIPPSGPVELRVRAATDPKHVSFEPGNIPLSWRRESKHLCITVPDVGIHGVVTIE